MPRPVDDEDEQSRRPRRGRRRLQPQLRLGLRLRRDVASPARAATDAAMSIAIAIVATLATSSSILARFDGPAKFSVSAFAPPILPSSSSSSRSRWASQSSSSSSALRSLRPLVDEIAELAGAGRLPGTPPPTVFVGGKGGVGKTSVSSSLAVALAAGDGGARPPLRVLIASTDPAHSLGDALDVDLRAGGDGRPLTLSDPLTLGNLDALEIDPERSLAEFRSNLEAFDPATLAAGMGFAGDGARKFIDGLGLDELGELLRDPPPGLDELVALSDVLDAGESGRNDEYDVILVDTAPTGHTLRMLQLPQFLDGFLSKLLEFRAKLSGFANTVQSFLGQGDGGGGTSSPTQQAERALEKLESFRSRAADLRSRLRDPERTKFVLVSAPTKLSVDESKRFLGELSGMGVRVSDVVINQCVGGVAAGEGETTTAGDDEKTEAYYRRRVAGQRRWISELKDACADVSSDEGYLSNVGEGGDEGSSAAIDLREVPFYDVELVGLPALGFLGGNTFARPVVNGDAGAERYEDLLLGSDEGANEGGRRNPKVILCGGKGGVGKTTTSCSLAVAMAQCGRNVAIVSTDPAHSIGDALGVDLSGGALVDCPLFGVPPSPLPGGEEGSLSAVEIDPAAALGEFKVAVDRLLGSKGGGGGDDDDGKGGEARRTLQDLGEIFDTLPAGTDEVVALARVVGLVRRGGFDRIVIDTAPTGHTLRMLSTPAFLADFIERMLKIARKVNSNAAIKMLLSSANKNKYDLDEAGEAAKDALLKFQVSMYDLEDLFADPSSTEFLIVTVPTELAVRESVRLLNDLTFGDPDMPIKVRSVVVNQVLNDDGGDGDGEAMRGFLGRLKRSQSSSIGDLRAAVDSTRDHRPRITEVPYLDTEPRGVYGLRALSEEYLSLKSETVTSQ